MLHLEEIDILMMIISFYVSLIITALTFLLEIKLISNINEIKTRKVARIGWYDLTSMSSFWYSHIYTNINLWFLSICANSYTVRPGLVYRFIKYRKRNVCLTCLICFTNFKPSFQCEFLSHDKPRGNVCRCNEVNRDDKSWRPS